MTITISRFDGGGKNTALLCLQASDTLKSTMKLSPDAIEELKQIYQEEFGTSLPDREALEMGLRLVNLFRIIYRPLPD